MAGRFCQECGAPNEAVAKYCAKCGSELRAGIPPPVPATPYGPATYGPATPPMAGAPAPYAYYPPAYGPAYPYPGQYPGYLGYAELERQKQVDRTKTGLLLLAVSFLISWIPLVLVIGVILAVIGAILVILGRKAFGPRHASSVVISVLLYVVSIVLAAIFFAWFFVASYEATNGNLRALLPVFWPFIGGVIGSGVLAGVAQVLFVHDLEKPIGRYLLYAAFVTAVVVPIVTALALASTFNAILADIANGTITNPNDPRLAPLYDAESTLALVDAIPSVLFGVVYFLAWQRIERREIPAMPIAAPAPGPILARATLPAPGSIPLGPPSVAPSEAGPVHGPPEPPPPP